jgi:aminoglycoside phosphotransferase (APT) family kinase protein
MSASEPTRRATTPGIDAPAVDSWLAEHLGLRPPCAYAPLAGGHSNLTFRVTDAGGRDVVLRRPPLGRLLPSAHDMGREHRIISALSPTTVPVPAPLGHCDDPALTGAPFYVMEHVAGQTGLAGVAQSCRARASEAYIDVLADLHLVDPDAVRLGDLGRREGYVERQLRRWLRQLMASSPTPPRPLVVVHERLQAAMPRAQRLSIVHGDFRPGNTLSRADGTVAAVLDWELCTLGDPLTDLALATASWIGPDDDGADLHDATGTSQLGFLGRAALQQRYSERAHIDLSELAYYMAFTHWRSACILEGVCARYRAGAKAQPADLSALESRARRLAGAALAALMAREPPGESR